MPANRTAALGAAATAIATTLATLLGAIETTQQAIVVSVALVAVGAVVVVYLIGSQRYDKLQADTALALGPIGDIAHGELIEDAAVDDVPLDELPTDDEEFAFPPSPSA